MIDSIDIILIILLGILLIVCSVYYYNKCKETRYVEIQV